jgi:hypothetical protein
MVIKTNKTVVRVFGSDLHWINENDRRVFIDQVGDEGPISIPVGDVDALIECIQEVRDEMIADRPQRTGRTGQTTARATNRPARDPSRDVRDIAEAMGLVAPQVSDDRAVVHYRPELLHDPINEVCEGDANA